MAVDGFTYWQSYRLAEKGMSARNRDNFRSAILAYMFDDEEPPEDAPWAGNFEGIRPNLDKSKKMSKNGAIKKQTGIKSKSNQIKSESNEKPFKKEKEVEIEKEKEGASFGFAIPEAAKATLRERGLLNA